MSRSSRATILAVVMTTGSLLWALNLKNGNIMKAKKIIVVWIAILLQIVLSACASGKFPGSVKTKIGTFTHDQTFDWYECKTKRGEAAVRYSVSFNAESKRQELDEAFRRIEKLGLGLDENEEKIIAFAARKIGRKAEDFYIYEIEIRLPNPKTYGKAQTRIEYHLFDKADEYGDPLYVICDEDGEPFDALFVG